MVKQNKNLQIIVGIIVLVALFYFLPKLNLFSILPTGECNFNSAGNFITNVNYGQTEEIEDYWNAPDSWISVNSIGYSARQRTYGGTSDLCANKQILTRTPKGYRVVVWNTNEVAICNEIANYVVFYTKNTNTANAITNINECSNYVAPEPQSTEPPGSSDIPPEGTLTQNFYCNDTDGQSFITKGIVSGKDLLLSPFSYTDKCVKCQACGKEHLVNEYSCVDNQVESNIYDCENLGSNYSCVDGACKSSSNIIPNCTYTYSAWTNCTNGTKSRTVLTTSPAICNGEPILIESCTPSSNFFSQELFKMGDFSVKLWMVLAIVIFIILLLLLRNK